MSNLIRAMFICILTAATGFAQESNLDSYSKSISYIDVEYSNFKSDYNGPASISGETALFLAAALSAQSSILGLKEITGQAMIKRDPLFVESLKEVYLANPDAMIANSKAELKKKMKVFNYTAELNPLLTAKEKSLFLERQMEVISFYGEIIEGLSRINKGDLGSLLDSFEIDQLEFSKSSQYFQELVFNPASENSTVKKIKNFRQKHFFKTFTVLSAASAILVPSVSLLTGHSPQEAGQYTFAALGTSMLTGPMTTSVLLSTVESYFKRFPSVSEEVSKAYKNRVSAKIKALDELIDRKNRLLKNVLSCKASF